MQTIDGVSNERRREREITKISNLNGKPKRRLVKNAPEGWIIQTKEKKIVRDTTTTWDSTTLEKRYLNLIEWANNSKVQLSPWGYSDVRYNAWSEIYVWSEFTYEFSAKRNNEALVGNSSCPSCKKGISVGTLFCPNAECMLLICCSTCRLAGLKLHGIPGAPNFYCVNCANECSEGCGLFVAPNDNNKKCYKCDPRETCGGCGVVFSAKELTKHKDKKNNTLSLCNPCCVKICETCKRHDHSTVSRPGKKGKLCQPCWTEIVNKERAVFEKWSKDEMPIHNSLICPSSAHRPVRTISIETEFDGNGQEVATALFNAGLTESPTHGRYSEQGGGRFPCLLKSDGSVSGGELVTFLIDMDKPNHAAAVLRMTEVMRGCRELGFAKFSKNAGGHIHIDLHGYGIDDLWALYTCFKYLEMPLYYIGGAGASYGHRSLGGSNYSPPPTLGPFGNKKAFAQAVQTSMGGRTGMHISNFKAAMNNCRCGSVFSGDWKGCTCNLGKATAEWRLWNAEVNPRILHAWIALMQSITAWGQDNAIKSEAAYPYLNWETRAFSSLASAKVDEIKKRLEWMFAELPLTVEEKDSIVYACKQSQLIGLGNEYLDGLMKVKTKSAFAAKSSKVSPASRKNVNFELGKVVA